jgi:hypothetical protein
MENPKVVHNDITMYDEKGNELKRNIDGDTDKSTLVTELNSIKTSSGYYVGYSINSWESSPGFMANIATCHISLLSDDLNIIRSVQIPNPIIKNDQAKIFATDLEMQIVSHKDTLMAVIQSPNAGKDKLFVQCFDKSLHPVNSLHYLTNSSLNYSHLVPVVQTGNGFLISYKEKKSNYTAIYTQLIHFNGRPELPVSVFSLPDDGDEYISSFHVKLDQQKNLNYYVNIGSKMEEKFILYEYQLPVADFMTAVNYQISSDNWIKDKKIISSIAVADAINKTIARKGFASFKKTTPQLMQKTAYADSSMVIRKYANSYKGKTFSYQMNFFYDQRGIIRMIQIEVKTDPGEDLGVKPGVFTVYFNEDGLKFWETKKNIDGTMEYGEKAVNSNKILRDLKIADPFYEFHKTTRL